MVTGDWFGLFTGNAFSSAGDLDVDHMVPLANAHRSGGWAWDSDTKRRYANDLSEPDHLIAVSAGANRSKGDNGPEEWQPPDRSYWCEYAGDWARIKGTWGLSVTSAEFTALQDMLSTCTASVLLQGIVGGMPSAPLPTPTSSRSGDAFKYDPFGADRDCGDFAFRAEVEAFFIAAGGPEADPHRLDGDGDGIPCESLR